MNRVITCEVDNTLVVTPFVAFEAGIWFTRLYIDANDEAGTFWVDGFGGNLDGISNAKLQIGSMIVGSTILAKMLSIDDLRSISDNGFYWDNANQDLYVKFNDLSPWYLNDPIRAGETAQYLSKAQNDTSGKPTNSVIGDIVYSVRVNENSISANKVEDKLRDNKMLFTEFSFDLINTDGALDNIRAEVINLGARIKLGEVDNGQIVTSSDLIVTRNGFMENVTFPDDKTARFTCSDPRAIFKDKIGKDKLTQTEYSDLDDKLVDKKKPLAIGNLTRIPTVRLEVTNLEPTGGSGWTGDIDFLIGDTQYGDITSVSNVYLDGNLYVWSGTEWEREPYTSDIPLTLTTDYTVDLSAGTVTIKQYAGGKIFVDCVGTKPTGTDKIIDQLFWFLDEFAGLTYLESFFWTDEVDIVRARADNYTGGYYIGTNGEVLKKVVDALASSVNVRLVEKQERFTIRDLFIDPVTTETHIIKNYELISTPSRDYDTDRYMSSILVSYNKNWEEKEFSTSLDTSDEDEAIIANSLQFTYPFDTYLDNKTDADIISTERYDINPPLHLNMKFASSLGFELYEYVLYELQRRNGTIIESLALYRVVQINDINRTARLRYIAVIALIPTLYQQGFLDNNRLFNGNLYSNTQGV